jgi:hypothetical protein
LAWAHRVWPLFFLLVPMTIGGCVQSNMRGRVVSPEDPAKTRTEIIERLVPEDGVMSRRRLGAVVEATTTVISDLDKRRFPLNANAVREVLQRASLADLRRIEAILPEVEKKRRIEGVD